MIKKSFRSSFDLTPWDKTGYSAFGLKRSQTKWIGTGLIMLGIIMSVPPIFPDPTDILNLGIANFITTNFGITPINALLMAYTIIPWVIFLVGIYIYPHNTRSLFNGYINKLKRVIDKYSKKPMVLLLFATLAWFVLNWYKTLI